MPADQAAGLRRWAGSRQTAPDGEAETRTLVVVGYPGDEESCQKAVGLLFRHWQVAGKRWIGDPARWRVCTPGLDDPRLPALARDEPRWGLWVASDPDGFPRAFRTLRRLHERTAPSRLLALHAPDLPARGLLNNLEQVARRYFDIQLVVLAS